MKKALLISMAAALTFNCSQKTNESIILNHTPATGGHCESSAILNSLLYQGFNITEEQIIGAGIAPGFNYEKTNFPFLGSRDFYMRENFSENSSIQFTKKIPESPEWDKITAILQNGDPVILRVDMRYLTYLYEGKYGPKYMSFGWHIITLFGLNWEEGTALVSDTKYQNLQLIKIKDLEKARFSNTDIYPPKGEYYWFEVASESFNPDWQAIAEKSIIQYYGNMYNTSITDEQLSGIEGLRFLENEIIHLSDRRPPSLVKSLLEYHSGCIEDFGTGGAAFRTLYFSFLKDFLVCENKADLVLKMEKCEQAWHNLATVYRESSEIYNKNNSNDVLSNLGNYANILYNAEKDLLDVIKKQYDL